MLEIYIYLKELELFVLGVEVMFIFTIILEIPKSLFLYHLGVFILTKESSIVALIMAVSLPSSTG